MPVELLERQKRFDSLLPQLVDAYSLAPSSVTEELVPEDAHALSPLFMELHDGICKQLAPINVAAAKSNTDIARATADCFEILQRRQQETREFLQTVCRQVVQIRVSGLHHPEAMTAALDSARRPLINAIDDVVVPIEPILTAELSSQPVPVIREAVQQWLQTTSYEVTSQLVVGLHTLVEMDAVGIIEWYERQCCKLHFFRQIVEQDCGRAIQTTKFRRNERGRMSVEEWERFRVRNRVFAERHEHHVMNAEACEWQRKRHVIPKEHGEFIDRVPEWLRPQLRVLQGDLILERVVRWKSHEETRDTQPKMRNSYELDPAILLGHYVLTGWGQREVEREIYRREREENLRATEPPARLSHEMVRDSANLQFTSNLAAVAAVVMMLFSPLQHRIMLPLSLLLSVAAIVTLGRSLLLRAVGGDQGLNTVDVATQCFTRAFGLLAIQSALFGVLYASWPMLGLALPLWLVAKMTRRLGQSRQQG